METIQKQTQTRSLDTTYQKLIEELKPYQDDLAFAKADYQETGIARDACFLSHQSAEKYLKGYLLANKTEPPRIHQLLKLLDNIVASDESFRKLRKQARLLDNYYNPAR